MSINKVVDYQVDETRNIYVHACTECGHTRGFNLPETEICDYCDEQFRLGLPGIDTADTQQQAITAIGGGR